MQALCITLPLPPVSDSSAALMMYPIANPDHVASLSPSYAVSSVMGCIRPQMLHPVKLSLGRSVPPLKPV